MLWPLQTYISRTYEAPPSEAIPTKLLKIVEVRDAIETAKYFNFNDLVVPGVQMICVCMFSQENEVIVLNTVITAVHSCNV
jgi:hypothetical protein